MSDGGIWASCSLKSYLERGLLDVADECVLPQSEERVTYHFIGDDAFPLNKRREEKA